MILALGGCLDEVFEAPYILVSGLPAATSFTMDGSAIRVATEAGLVVVDGSGKPGAPGAPVEVVDGLWSLHAGSVAGPEGRRIEAPGAVDLLARAEGVWVAFPDRMEWYGLDGQRATDRIPCAPRAVAPGPETRPLILCEDRLLDMVHPDPPLATGLVDARATAMDDRGRIYVVQGTPPQLYRVEAGLQLVARFLGEVEDVAFGRGPLLPRENLYLLRAEGQVDYLRPP